MGLFASPNACKSCQDRGRVWSGLRALSKHCWELQLTLKYYFLHSRSYPNMEKRSTLCLNLGIS